MGRNTILLRMAALCAILTAWTAHGEMTIHVQAGIGDNVRGGAITPVRARITNDTEQDYNGRLSVAFKPSLGGRPIAWYRRDVPMPPGSEKVVYFYVPLVVDSSAVVALYETASGRDIAETEGRINYFSEDRPVMLTVSEAPFGLPPMKADNKSMYFRVGCLPADIPRDALGLAMFDAIVISPTPPTPFRGDQMLALRDWVLDGGTLIIDASRRTDFTQDPAIAALLPFTPVQQEQAQLSMFDTEANFARGQVTRGEVILGDEDQPLVIRGPYGLGSVTALAINPDTPAIKRWDGVHDLWDDLLDPAGIGSDVKRFDDVAPRQADSDVSKGLREVVSTGPRSGVRLGIVVLLTALYALAVGPGDYFLVRRLGKPKLTWITFPIIVIVFTAAAYYGARIYVGGELAQLYRDRVRIFADEKITARYEIASVFAPVGRRYIVDTEENHMIIPLRLEAQVGDPVMDVHLDEGVVSQHIPIWTQRYFERRTRIEQEPPVRFELTVEDDQVFATIENTMDVPLSNLTIAYRSGTHTLEGKTVGAGETERFLVGNRRRLEVDQTRASWPREPVYLSRVLERDMAFALESPGMPLVNQRDAILGNALDQGAAVLMCIAPAPTEGFRINGENVAPEGARHIQVVTYDGVQL